MTLLHDLKSFRYCFNDG